MNLIGSRSSRELDVTVINFLSQIRIRILVIKKKIFFFLIVSIILHPGNFIKFESYWIQVQSEAWCYRYKFVESDPDPDPCYKIEDFFFISLSIILHPGNFIKVESYWIQAQSEAWCYRYEFVESDPDPCYKKKISFF